MDKDSEMEDQRLKQDIQALRRIDVKLEEALRETLHYETPNNIDLSIQRIRREIQERLQNLQHQRKSHPL